MHLELLVDSITGLTLVSNGYSSDRSNQSRGLQYMHLLVLFSLIGNEFVKVLQLYRLVVTIRSEISSTQVFEYFK
jgi:hypothetical protein